MILILTTSNTVPNQKNYDYYNLNDWYMDKRIMVMIKITVDNNNNKADFMYYLLND